MTTEEQPMNQTEPAEPVVQQAPEAAQEQGLAPCPCGKVPESVIIEMQQRAKYGRVFCPCGEWGLEFRNGYAEDPAVTQAKATKAWNEAPRG